MKYPITEIFRSIQGEGVQAGRSATFVRFSGCNLACSWCDTDHAMKEKLTAKEITKRVDDLGVNFVVLTGGEPMLHLDEDLLGAFRFAGSEVAIETNGTIQIPRSFHGMLQWITVSPKSHLGADFNQRIGDELKIVWDGKVDPCAVARGCDFNHYVLQPEWSKRSKWVPEVLGYIEDYPQWRLSIQLHKILSLR